MSYNLEDFVKIKYKVKHPKEMYLCANPWTKTVSWAIQNYRYVQETNQKTIDNKVVHYYASEVELLYSEKDNLLMARFIETDAYKKAMTYGNFLGKIQRVKKLILDNLKYKDIVLPDGEVCKGFKVLGEYDAELGAIVYDLNHPQPRIQGRDR